jgi:hypothetical protein
VTVGCLHADNDSIMKTLLTPHEIRRLAVVACVDPRTLKMYAEGRARSTTSARIDAALVDLGLDHLRAAAAAARGEHPSKGPA